jgi:hypothetical protein
MAERAGFAEGSHSIGGFGRGRGPRFDRGFFAVFQKSATEKSDDPRLMQVSIELTRAAWPTNLI